MVLQVAWNEEYPDWYAIAGKKPISMDGLVGFDETMELLRMPLLEVWVFQLCLGLVAVGSATCSILISIFCLLFSSQYINIIAGRLKH